MHRNVILKNVEYIVYSIKLTSNPIIQVHNLTKTKIINTIQCTSGWIGLDQEFMELTRTISYYGV